MAEFLAEPPRPIRPGDPVDSFDCGVEDLNRYLQRFAWMNQQANAAVTYVVIKEPLIAGYYTIVAASAEHGESPRATQERPGATSDSGSAACPLSGGSAISRRRSG